MYECMYGRMDEWMCVCVFVHVCMYVECMYVCMYVCVYVCMFSMYMNESIYECMHVCMYVVMYVFLRNSETIGRFHTSFIVSTEGLSRDHTVSSRCTTS